MRPFIEAVIQERRAQSSIEAALLLPVLVVVFALLLQSGIVMYTKINMRVAAAQACRLYAVQAEGFERRHQKDRYREFVLHRLQAVPKLEIFHKGSDKDWNIRFETSQGSVAVSIEHEYRPLPLWGLAASFMGYERRDGAVTTKVKVSSPVRPAWIKGGYREWQAQWS